MQNTDEVRVATPEDRSGVLELLRLYHEENGGTNWDEEGAGRAIDASLVGANGFVGVIGPTEDIRAMTWVVPVMQPSLALEECAMIVKPEYREQGGYTSKIVKGAKLFAEKTGLRLHSRMTSRPDNQRKIESYRRHYGEPTTFHFFVYDPSPAPAGG
ncbi:hypothetical protein [Chelatococcus sp.]|uniref:hypothetical protein n=1 Tax=Chelatococcus sp. TaxID=1953771 RepID=UPI001ECF1075|nr:hypothetical protein [Chelatococcus sp.]MBX3543746.1 hypothetical protein [Chelatococcus sp.]CAH1677784.1 hypothetical protein CHELA41_24443 [Hyphomicrobiales bacterium]